MLINPSSTLNNLGGKGYQLSLLNKFCSVPEFFVICFESDNEIVSSTVQEEIIRTFDFYAFDYVSVRSSATVEDSAVASFAGMFETKLNVTRDNLINSVKNVLNSLKNNRVAKYCELNGLNIIDIKMRVIVQRMVDSKVAGVCITKDISNPDVMIIEACWGLGDALVGGMVAPDTYKVNRVNFKIESTKIGHQRKMVVSFNYEKAIEVPFHLCNSKKLTNDKLVELAKMCLFIEKKLNYEIADIEWAFEKDKLYVLQARPFVGKL
ncbi:MAG: PEP/pyruvate-binding domain-containing protein [Nitrososphaerota archaeon]|jgi:pyruvate,water dikinase|nr:PEP/pyruvate-binding domain-containing protein [Nitrososphaerota archaeon]